jgi:hypothetical protein
VTFANGRGRVRRHHPHAPGRSRDVPGSIVVNPITRPLPNWELVADGHWAADGYRLLRIRPRTWVPWHEKEKIGPPSCLAKARAAARRHARNAS